MCPCPPLPLNFARTHTPMSSGARKCMSLANTVSHDKRLSPSNFSRSICPMIAGPCTSALQALSAPSPITRGCQSRTTHMASASSTTQAGSAATAAPRLRSTWPPRKVSWSCSLCRRVSKLELTWSCKRRRSASECGFTWSAASTQPVRLSDSLARLQHLAAKSTEFLQRIVGRKQV